MKKIVFALLMLLTVGVKAQNSSMTITNHASCPAEIILYASFGYMGYPNCGLHVQLVIPAGATITKPTYWDFHASFPLLPLGGAPIPPCIPFGPAPSWTNPDGFHWEWVFVYGATTPGQIPGAGLCFPTATCAGTPCGSSPCVSAHRWVNTSGDIVLDIY